MALNNPYTAPGADLSQAGTADATYDPKLFSVHGRIGRVRYIVYLVVSFMLVMLATIGLMIPFGMAFNSGAFSFLPVLCSLAFFAVTFVLAIRRLNDISMSGWLSILMLVPVVNFIISLWLLFAPGAAGSNQSGPAPGKNSSGVVAVFAITMATMALVLIFSGISAYGVYKLSGSGLSGNPPASARQVP